MIADRVKDTSTSTGTGNFVLSGAAPVGFQPLSSIGTTGATFGYVIDGGAQWECGIGTITAANTFSRAPSGSSNGGALVPFSAGTKTVFNGVTAAQYSSFLTVASGVTIPDFLAGAAAGTASGSDLALVAQGANVVGMTLSSLANFVQGLWQNSRTKQVRVTSTAAFPLDFTQHNRKRIVMAAIAQINGPASYGTVGDEFECMIKNVSGGAVPFGSGITCLPSGSSLPNGQSANLWASAGVIYADLPVPASSGAVIPGAVTGNATSAPSANGLTVSYTAPSTGTAPFGYVIQYRVTSVGGAWTTAAIGVSATSYAITGLAAGTQYDTQVAASNAAGTGAFSNTAIGTTSAAPAAPGQVVGLAHGTMTNSAAPLSWTALTGATSYKAQYRVTSVGGAWTDAATGITGTSYTVTALTPSTGYDFRVVGSNSSGDGTPSATVTGTTAAAAVAPFTVTARTSFPTAIPAGGSDFLWSDVTPTGAATVASVVAGVSTSNTIPPTSAIGSGTSPKGHWLGAFENYGGGTSWLTQTASFINYSVAATNFYLWLIVTDSDGAVWNFCHTAPINCGDSVAKAVTNTITPYTAVP